MKLFDLGIFSGFAYLGYTNAGDFFGNIMALMAVIWCWQIVALELEERNNKRLDSSEEED